jgi:hypothetical protein
LFVEHFHQCFIQKWKNTGKRKDWHLSSMNNRQYTGHPKSVCYENGTLTLDFCLRPLAMVLSDLTHLSRSQTTPVFDQQLMQILIWTYYSAGNIHYWRCNRAMG